MKHKVLLTHPFLMELAKREFKGQAQFILRRSLSDIRKSLGKVDGAVTVLTVQFNRPLLEHATHLKVLGNMAVGVDNIDLQVCSELGIKVVNTPKVLTRATAELATTLLLSVARRVPEGEEMCRKGRFKIWEPDMLLGLELQGRRALIVGKGRIGKETSRIFKGLGLKVDFLRSKDSESTIHRKLKSAQILSLHVPLNSNTHHWLNRRRIALLPRDAIVINTSRGPIIDEKSLIAALKSKRIFGAGLDVYEREPSIPAALKGLDNVVLLPHIGSATRKTRADMARTAISGTLKVLRGQRPHNLVKL